MIKELIGAGIVIESITGCAPVPADAVTTPIGIFYLTDKPTDFVVEHEKCHWDKAQKEGIQYWEKMMTDPAFSCEEERRCGIEPTDYPATYPLCVKK